MLLASGLPAVLCLIPLAALAMALRSENRREDSLAAFRLICFRCGCLAGILSSLATANCWAEPFPLVQKLDGSLSIDLLEWAFAVAFGLALLSFILSFFGRGWPRGAAVARSLALIPLAFGAMLQNAV